MNIGQVASASGVSVKMIRHYEAIGLIPKVSRSLAGYRHYQSSDLHLLCFIRRARAAGFSTAQIKKLLSLWQDQQRPAREVKELASAHLADLKTRIAELESIAQALTQLIGHCQGDERPQCPILDNLAGDDNAY